MDVFLLYLPLLLVSLVLLFGYKQKSSSLGLPPGKKGWPILGETWEFFMTGWRGTPEKFVKDRMCKYSEDVFQTSLFGESMAVFCGPAGNKFLFSNDNKYVTAWWPPSFEKVVGRQEDDRALRAVIAKFLKIEALHDYVSIMDSMTRQHLDEEWSPCKKVKVLTLSKQHTFAMACRIFLGIEDHELVKGLVDPFKIITAGLMSVPINFPGTAFNRAIKAGNLIRQRLVAIVKQKKEKLMLENKEPRIADLLTHMVLESNENERQICSNILSLLIASHDTSSTVITSVMNYLAEYPHIYQEVFKEQMEIVKSKSPGELLNWQDILKMKYSWCVACETLRLLPPGGGTFRETITDFTYAGFTIPRGWKAHWTAYSTHKNPKYFPEPEKFDPSRFEGSGPMPFTFVPFGGGPRMCVGKEYARLKILVFIHNVVTKFKWKKVNPNEKIIYCPLPTPVNGLVIQLESIKP